MVRIADLVDVAVDSSGARGQQYKARGASASWDPVIRGRSSVTRDRQQASGRQSGLLEDDLRRHHGREATTARCLLCARRKVCATIRLRPKVV
jgi:hypothetical protein